MKRLILIGLIIASALFCTKVRAQQNLRIVFIRHGEKPPKGDNLTCQGINRALALPQVLVKKFGVPQAIYVPALGLGEATKHARMFETVMPLAAKYNLQINTSHQEKDSTQIAADLKTKTGVVLVVWEHKALVSLMHALGIEEPALKWPDDDYDSIWILDFKDAKPQFTRDKENIHPTAACNF